MELNLIYARARNGVIGNNGKLPWSLPEDMAHFRAMTLGNVVIMGRKTFQSLSGPLAGRINIVITRDPALPLPGSNVYLAAGFKEALAIAQRICDMREARETWVIGGAEIYQQAMPYATRIEVTEINSDFKGDTTMPKLSWLAWKKVSEVSQSTSVGIKLKFVTYKPRQRVTQWAKSAVKYLTWLLAVQLLAWSPSLLSAFDLIGSNGALVLHVLLTTAGAIYIMGMLSMCRDLFLNLINRKE